MKEAPYNKEKDHDDYLEKIISGIRDHISDKDDDYILNLVGDPGTGKSTLALHILGIYLPTSNLNLRIAAFSKTDFADSLKYSSTAVKPRALWYDEANIQKRDAMTKWNRQLLDLYFACRGLNIFHIWCNPSLEVLDKPFLEERLKAVVLVVGKNIGVRYYFYFRKADVLQIYTKYGKLTIDLLKKVRHKYCYYRGWFKDYNGPLKQEYLEKKASRMNNKVEEFFNSFSTSELLTPRDVYSKLGIREDSLRRYVKRGMLVENEHYITTPSGHRKYKPEAITHLLNYSKNSIKKVVEL